MLKRSADVDEGIDKAIGRVLYEMDMYGPDTEEYPRLLSHLERLNTVRLEKRNDGVSSDTKASIFANLAGILIIVGYERMHSITSKALGSLYRR